MLKSEDITKLAKECKLEVNVDFEYDFDNSKSNIYHIYALLLEIKDRFELCDYFFLTDQELPPMLKNNRTEEILDELLNNGVINGY